MSLISRIKTQLSKSLSNSSGISADRIYPLLEKPKNKDHGDIALPCFMLAKDKKVSPAILAEEIEKSIILPETVSAITRLGPFLNFSINYSNVAEEILAIAGSGEITSPELPSTTIVEYSSPNIAKPFHVGHLRATLIGNSLDRTYRFAEHKVESINHLGDWGTQFGFVWAGCTLWGEPEEFTVRNLVELYKKATSLKDQQEKEAQSLKAEESVQELARAYFIRLESGEKEALEFWKRCVDTSLSYLKDTYKRLDISFDHYLGESFYSDKLETINEELKSKNLLQESQGALGVDLGEELGFARILTPDGRSLYLTRDIAAAEYRYSRFKFGKSLYVVGAPQSLHFNQLKKILDLLSKPYAAGIEHIAFGHVLGMKTRGEGQSIELNDFIDEAIQRALDAYRSQVSKRPEGLEESEVAEKVALSAIIFSTLNRNNIKDVHFSWDDALSFQGDSGPYLLYAYARINGIREKALSSGLSVSDGPFSEQTLEKSESRTLLLTILELNEVIQSTIQTNEPIHLCSYALELSKCISKAYLQLKVIGEEKTYAESNLRLFLAAQKCLKTVFSLLGFSPLERM